MKRSFYLGLGGIGLLFLFLLRCQVKNPTEDLKLIVNFEPIKTTVAVDFVDAKTDATIDDRRITLRIEGKDRGLVVDMNNEPVTEFLVEGGLLGFGLQEGTTPTAEAPIALRLVASAEGYLSTGVLVFIDSTGGHPVTIVMVKKNNLPAGTAAETDRSGSTSTNGVLQASLVIQTDPEPASGCRAAISLPQGTTIRDVSGNPLQGPLTVELIYFNNQSQEALDAFPGGFTVQVSADPEGNPGEGVFITAGFLAVTLTDGNGRQAATFDPPITLTIEIDPQTINPTTGSPVQTGDVIPVWSYHEETGEWKYEGPGLVSGPNAHGKMEVAYQTGHLSWWNLDWWWWWCSWGKKILLIGKTACDGCLWVNVRSISGGFSSWQWVCDDWIQFYGYVPKGLPVILEVYTRWRRLLGTLRIEDLCDLTEATISIQLQRDYYRVFHFSGLCPNKGDLEIRPSIPVWIRKRGSGRWVYLGYVKDGTIELCGFDVPEEYEVCTYYRGRYYKAVFRFERDYSVFLPEYSLNATAEVRGVHVYYRVILPENVCSRL